VGLKTLNTHNLIKENQFKNKRADCWPTAVQLFLYGILIFIFSNVVLLLEMRSIFQHC